MKRKFISVVTFAPASADGDFTQRIDALCVEHATVEQLMSILQLAPAFSKVEITMHEEEVQSPFDCGFASQKDA